ncbi:MAG: OmpA family protein, partial [Verrucomicrobiaceae bacterium]|nr:OmpA family protein [Verrucomicrobiaceae bacterium]
GKNYLLGTNAKVKAQSRIGEEALEAETVAQAMLLAGAKSSFLFLDCCREAPPAEWITRGARKRGLADVKVDGDIIIAYAAKPGDSALDLPTITGADVSTGNGPYAQSVARFIATGLKHTDFFQQVRKEVARLTGGTQRTWENGSFLDEFYFSPPGSTPVMPAPRVEPVDLPPVDLRAMISRGGVSGPDQDLLAYAIFAYDQGAANLASQSFAQYLQRYPAGTDVPVALYALGCCYLKMDLAPQAATYFTEVVSRYPSSVSAPWALFELRKHYLMKGNSADAEAYGNYLIKHHSNSVPALFLLNPQAGYAARNKSNSPDGTQTPSNRALRDQTTPGGKTTHELDELISGGVRSADSTVQTSIPSDILFENGNAELSAGSRLTLMKIGFLAQKYPQHKVTFEVHTDSVGTAEFNKDLSRRRAQSIVNWLNESLRLTTERFEIIGKGESEPLVSQSGTTVEPSSNRRIDIIIAPPKNTK